MPAIYKLEINAEADCMVERNKIGNFSQVL